MSWTSFLTKSWFLAHHPELWTLDLLLQGLIHPLGLVVFCTVFFPIAGWLAGVRPGQHTSRSFFHDLCYYFFYQFGFYDAIFTVALISLVTPHISHLNLLGNWPLVPRLLTYWLIGDFMLYWMHRIRHSCKFIWAFHATHHAPERLTFAAQNHVHPIDEFISAVVLYFPFFTLGRDPTGIILPIMLLNKLAAAAQHTELPWRLGPLYYIFVTPAFHSFHHSTDPKHYNKNYGTYLSVWDFLFGTAVDEKELPAHYGLPDIKMQTLGSQMLTPMRLIYEWYFKKSAVGVAPDAEAQMASVQ